MPRGVYQTPSGRFQVSFKYSGTKDTSGYIGIFDTQEQASAAYTLVRGELDKNRSLSADKLDGVFEAAKAQALKAAGEGVSKKRQAAKKGDLPRGVDQISARRFRARITYSGTKNGPCQIGLFDTPEQASAAYTFVRNELDKSGSISAKALDGVFKDAKARALEAFQAVSATRKKRQAKSAKRKKLPGSWSGDEITRLSDGIQASKTNWTKISDHVKTRTPERCKSKNQEMQHYHEEEILISPANLRSSDVLIPLADSPFWKGNASVLDCIANRQLEYDVSSLEVQDAIVQQVLGSFCCSSELSGNKRRFLIKVDHDSLHVAGIYHEGEYWVEAGEEIVFNEIKLSFAKGERREGSGFGLAEAMMALVDSSCDQRIHRENK